MKKYCIFLCLFIILLLCGCSEDSDESKSANGYCPFQLEGKTLLLRNMMLQSNFPQNISNQVS